MSLSDSAVWAHVLMRNSAGKCRRASGRLDVPFVRPWLTGIGIDLVRKMVVRPLLPDAARRVDQATAGRLRQRHARLPALRRNVSDPAVGGQSGLSDLGASLWSIWSLLSGFRLRRLGVLPWFIRSRARFIRSRAGLFRALATLTGLFRRPRLRRAAGLSFTEGLELQVDPSTSDSRPDDQLQIAKTKEVLEELRDLLRRRGGVGSYAGDQEQQTYVEQRLEEVAGDDAKRLGETQRRFRTVYGVPFQHGRLGGALALAGIHYAQRVSGAAVDSPPPDRLLAVERYRALGADDQAAVRDVVRDPGARSRR